MEEELDSVQEKLNTSIIKVCIFSIFLLKFKIFPMIIKQWYFMMMVELISGHQMLPNFYRIWGIFAQNFWIAENILR